mgnify:CR=1 FL=1
MHDFFIKQKPLFLLVLMAFSFSAYAEKVGKKLTELSFASQPYDFHYSANGKHQLITVYPAKPSSMKNGEFNFKVQRLGFCPIAVTDIFNKAWYAPTKMVEREMRKNVKSKKHNPKCKLSGDHEGVIGKTWGLKPEAVTIIVDGQGIVQFLEYGVLSDEQQDKAIKLLQQ